MVKRSHLFLAMHAGGFGEIGVGLRIARELTDEGDRVIFLAPSSARVLFEGSPFDYAALEDDVWDLKGRITSLALREHCASLALIDVTAVLLALEGLYQDDAFLEQLDLPVVAFDIWNIREAAAEWDLGGDAVTIPPLARRFTRRLVSVPFNKPSVEGAFDALPRPTESSSAERARVRDELGLPPEAKLLLVATSRFQLPEFQGWKHGQRLVRLLPGLVAEVLRGLDSSIHVLHVGPAAFQPWGVLGDRYRWVGQVTPERFSALVGASDLLVNFNTAATTTGVAIALGVPVLTGINSFGGRTRDEVAAAMGGRISEVTLRWLEDVVPLSPFHVWGAGLHRFFSRILQDNPYVEAFQTVEILDVDAFTRSCRELLFDAAARDRALARQAAYRESLAGLPSPREAYRRCL